MLLSQSLISNLTFYSAIFFRAIIGQLFVFCLLYVSYVLSIRLSRDHATSTICCGVYIISCWLLSVIFHLLIACRFFSLLPAVGVVAVLAYCAWIFDPDSRSGILDIYYNLRERCFAFKRSERFFVFLPLLLFLLFTGILLSRVILLPLLGWDALTYHAIKAAWWVQTGHDINYNAPGGWEYYRTFFAGGEVFTSWAMLIFHSDLLAGLPDIVHWLGLGIVVYSISREVQSPRWLSTVISILLLSTLQVSRFVGSGYVDTCQNSLLLGGVFFLCRFFRRQQTGELLLASAAFGVAVATKFTSLFTTILCGAICLAWCFKHRKVCNRMWRDISIAILIFLLPFIRWLILNYQQTGYPLGSIPFAIGPVRLGLSPPNFEWFLQRPDLHPYSLKDELTSLVHALWRFRDFLVFSLFGLLGMIHQLRKNPWQASVLLCPIVGVIAYYYSPTFAVHRLGWPGEMGRFLLPCVVISAAAGMGWLANKRKSITAFCMFTCISVCLNIYWYWHFFLIKAPREECILIVITIALIVSSIVAIDYCFLHAFSKKPTFSYAATILLVAIFLTCIQSPRNWLRNTAYSFSTVALDLDIHRYWVSALSALEKEPQEKTIAVTAGAWNISQQWFIYPFMGPTFENHLCYVSPEHDGNILPHHPEFLKNADPDYRAWMIRLEEHGVTHVMSFVPENGDLNWMESNPHSFARLAGLDNMWGFFRFEGCKN
ncbi:MAG: hypothetical protein V1844_02740 [Pseudomonadota bacterium]